MARGGRSALVGIHQGLVRREIMLLANAGPDRVGTQLKGPVTVLLVFVGHRGCEASRKRVLGCWSTGMGKRRWWWW